MPVSIKGTGGGGVTLDAGAASNATTLTLPNTTGTVALTASPTFTGTLTASALSVSGTSTLTGAVTATTITSPSATALTFQYGGTTGFTLDTSGNFLLGTTNTSATNANGIAVLLPTAATTISVGHVSGSASGASYFYMNYNGSNIGSISQNGTTAVAYNTASDYRLKESVVPMTTGLATINALKPVTYDWISDKSVGEGFIAHELAEIIPLAVTGEKDAIDNNGNPYYQGVDYSKIVVHLVSAIQELSAKNDALEARLAALEAK